MLWRKISSAWAGGARVAGGRGSARHKRPLRVLLIDHRIPRPDHGAGARSVAHLLTLFRMKGFRVLFWPEHFAEESEYTDLLRAQGIKVVSRTAKYPSILHFLRERGSALDVVFLSRPMFEQEFFTAVRAAGRPRLLYYGHDIHHLHVERRISAEGETPELRSLVEANRRVEFLAWAHADAVYYPSESESEFVREHMRRTGSSGAARTLPVFAFDSFEPEQDGPGVRSGVLFVGCFTHSPNVSGVDWLAREIWPLVAAANSETILRIVGGDPPPAVTSLASDRIKVEGQVSDEALAAHYRNARVVVAPLLFGGGIKGKIVEAMRFGVPVVTTSIGAQGFDEPGTIMMIADNPLDNAAAIGRLLTDGPLWRSLSVAGSRYVRRRFTREATWAVLADQMRRRGRNW